MAVVVYFWMIGLFFHAYLVSRMVLEAYPYQAHWLAIPIGLAEHSLVSRLAGYGIAGEETLFSNETLFSGNDVVGWDAFASSLSAGRFADCGQAG